MLERHLGCTAKQPIFQDVLCYNTVLLALPRQHDLLIVISVLGVFSPQRVLPVGTVSKVHCNPCETRRGPSIRTPLRLRREEPRHQPMK